MKHGDLASTVLIVEDDPHTVELVSLYLTRDGHKVLSASDGLDGLRMARESEPDLVALDLMLPGLDGMEVCRALRAESDVPIVMLTARVDEEDRLAGLDLGADDYVTKPFSSRELAARIRAVLRRAAPGSTNGGSETMVHGEVTVNMARRAVTVKDRQVELTPTEFRLLVMLMRQPGRVFTRDQIMDRVLGFDFDGFDRTVDAHVSNLRRKLEASTDRAQYVRTVRGVGYKFSDD